METTKSVNIPSLSVNSFVDLLTDTFVNIYRKDKDQINKFPSVMLWGAPGVGKSQGVRQIANNIEMEIGIPVYVADVRLLLFNPIDLRGIPVADTDKKFAIWLKPKIFQMQTKNCINILFLDEISAAPQSVQAAAYQITLDRQVGEHKLPDNCIVIAAGNRVTDKSVAVKMPKALANRLLHIEVEGDFDSWKKWAISKNINDKVLAYLSENRNRLFGFNPECDDLAFPTPRSWEMVSNILNTFDGDAAKSFPLISGLIGIGEAMEFRGWCKVYKDLPNIENIFKGVENKTPKSMDVLYTLIMSMVSYASTCKYDQIKIGNSLNYARKLPPDFVELLLQNYELLDKNYSKFLKQLPEYINYATSRGSSLNGKI